MKRVTVIVLIAVFVMLGAGPALAGEKAPQKVFDLANATLAGFGSDPVIVEAVRSENAKGKTLDQIKGTDDKWKATAGIADNMQAIMASPAGKHLRSIQESKPFFSEIFVMDNQGANVAMTDKTSDYWQGDEAKFKKSFADGKGAVFVDEVAFDESAQAYLVQVSVPVKDGANIIGAMTFGIDVDKLD